MLLVWRQICLDRDQCFYLSSLQELFSWSHAGSHFQNGFPTSNGTSALCWRVRLHCLRASWGNDLITEWRAEAVDNGGQWNNPISKKSAITCVLRRCFHKLSGFLEQCVVVMLFVGASLSELSFKPSFYKSASFVDNCNSHASKTSCRTSLL